MNTPDWGHSKGSIRGTLENRVEGVHNCVYTIEEPPGYRVIRYNKRKYRIFFPWVYFFVKVYYSDSVVWSKVPYHSVNLGTFFISFSKKRADDMNEPCLLQAVFPNTEDNGSVCLPPRIQRSSRAIEVAMSMIYSCWGSNGNEFHLDYVPEAIAPHCKSWGTMFRKWQGLSPYKIMELPFKPFWKQSLTQAAAAVSLKR